MVSLAFGGNNSTRILCYGYCESNTFSHGEVSMEALLSPPSPGDNVEGSLLLFVDALYTDIVAALSFGDSNCVKKHS